MKLVLISSVFIFFLFNTSISNSELITKEVENKVCLSNYKIKISLNSYEYFVYQEVSLNIEFEYLGNKIDSLNLNITNLSQNIIVKNLSGETSSWAGEIVDPNYIKFMPGEKRNFKYDLNYYWGFKKFDTPNSLGFYRHFPPDIYTVQFKIKSEQVKSSAFMEQCKADETLSSNIINFKVIEPTGENKEALDMIKRIYKLNIMGGKEIDEYIRLNNIFIKNYYSTIYINEMFISQSGYREILNRYDELALEEAMIILNNYPDDLISRSAISQAYNYYKTNYNEERSFQFLEEAKENYKNQEAGKWAEHELNRIRGN